MNQTVCSPSLAKHVLNTLVQWPSTSVVRRSFEHIVALLDEQGYASLERVCAALYPDHTLEAARKALSTEVVNRAYKNGAGQTPLRLCISRKSKHTAVEAQRVWFEADNIHVPSDAPLDTPRYEATRFTGGLAQEVSAKEVVQVLRQEAKDALNAVRSANDKTQLNVGRPNPVHGLGTGSTRGAEFETAFVNTAAQATEGFEALGKPVICLNAMIEWACDASLKAPRLLALLGDYGTGKTSHGMQLDRVLNGLVPVPSDVGLPAGTRLPKPVFIDLALLAGVENMAYLNLTEILTVALNKRRSGAVIEAATLIAQAKAGEVVMLYDGLDELLKHNEGHSLHKLLDQLLRVLESDPVTQKPSKAKIMVSCRTHYFRDLQSQHAFFDTRRRGVAQANDYLCLSLLLWNERSIQEYLGKRLNTADAAALQGIIHSTYKLAELASKPVLLAMMCEQVGQLLREKASGAPVTASRLYSITVGECLARDNGKHTIKPHHKPLLMGALATAMWNEGVEQWSADKLDAWLARAVTALFPNQYGAVDMGALQDDLRTATFIVRRSGRSEGFNFSHRSFMEYFIARWVWDSVNCQHDGMVDEVVLRQYLPRRELNAESTQFAREMWLMLYKREDTQTIALRQSVYLWRCLQGDHTDAVRVAPDSHIVLFKLILALGLAKKNITQPALDNHSQYLIKSKAVNLRGIELIQERWEDLDFSGLPSIDFTDANLLCLRAWRCNFGRLLCSGGNWAQTVFRDCAMNEIAWGDADKGGMMIRHGERRPITRALKGPWTRPTLYIYQLNTVTVDRFLEKIYLNKLLFKNKSEFYLIDVESGRLCLGSNKVDQKNLNCIEKGILSFDAKSNFLFIKNIQKNTTHRIIKLNYIDKMHFGKKLWLHGAFGESCSYATFDANGNLLDYDDEAADTWLFCLASGRPEPVETALPVE